MEALKCLGAMTTLPHHAVLFLEYFFLALLLLFLVFVLFFFFSVVVPAFFDFVISHRFILIKRKFAEHWPSPLTIKRDL